VAAQRCWPGFVREAGYGRPGHAGSPWDSRFDAALIHAPRNGSVVASSGFPRDRSPTVGPAMRWAAAPIVVVRVVACLWIPYCGRAGVMKTTFSLGCLAVIGEIGLAAHPTNGPIPPVKGLPNAHRQTKKRRMKN